MGSIPNSPTYKKNVSGIISTPITKSSNTSGLIDDGNAPSTLATQKPLIPGLIPPSTPAKSTAVTHPDGTTVTQTFHAPVEDSAVKSDSSGTTKQYAGYIASNQVNAGTADKPNIQTTPSQNNGSQSDTQITQQQNPNVTQVDQITGQPIAPKEINRQNAAQQVYNTSQTNDQIQQDKQRMSQLFNTQQVGQLAPFSDANLYNVNDPNSRPNLNVPDFYQQKSSDQSLYNNLSGLGYGAAVNAYQADLQDRGQQQQGAEAVLGATQPILGSYGQNDYNTLSGGSNGGTIKLTGQPANDLSTLSSSVANNSVDYNTAYGQLSSAYGAAVANQLLPAIQKTNPSFNVNQSIGQGSATQSITSSQQQQKTGYQSALQQGQNLQSQLTDLIGTFGLNPSDINVANAGLQKIANNVSDPHYKALNNYVNDIANTYSQILTPPGGSATDTTRGIASSMLDATMSGQGLIQVMQSLDQAANAKIAGVVTQGNNTGSGSSVPNSFAESWY